MRKIAIIILIVVVCVAMCACGNMSATPGTTPVATPTVTPTPDADSIHSNHELLPYLYGEWRLIPKDKYIHEIPCSSLIINEDKTCIADGVNATWKIHYLTHEGFLRIDIYSGEELIMCAAYYGTGNTIGVWHTWYEGGVDNSWEKVAQ